jgi:type II secretory ATPase GspE/PulE/Tfp pilus assembly ATPase PilB-like protein
VSSIADYVTYLMSQAKQFKATDIHLEPFNEGLRVRFRVDGILEEGGIIPKILENNVLGRFKLLAGMVIEERRMPQDGSFSYTLADDVVLNSRVATIPTRFGESLVVRLLTSETQLNSLKDLGVSEDAESFFKHLIAVEHGLVLIAGPTGSGKTTTVHTILKSLDKVKKKIITIEDPIEYELEGISQIRVQTTIGMSFATALRSILRQVPDTIFVGEIRDSETAQIAIQAALTGHKVYATIHTNDALSTITRLSDLGVKPAFVITALKGVIHQQLVRRLCRYCRTLVSSLSNSAHAYTIQEKSEIFPKVFQARGCSACNFKGFSGRCGLFEIVWFTEAFKTFYLNKDICDAHAIWNFIEETRIGISLKTDVMHKLLQGMTTIEEVL